MGRRSTKTTKAGKFMNPTDQFRKEQRKKELKKNKKQRQIVREAVLRMKDVGQMLKEIEEIEEQELRQFGPQHNEKGLEEKKSKLHASIHRVARYYQQEDPKKAQELKLMIVESEQRRREMSRVYHSYRAARSKYSIEDIPLPDASEGGLHDIPMPAASGLTEEQSVGGGLVPPPPPAESPPPDLVEYNVVESTAPKSVRFAEEDSSRVEKADSDSNSSSSSDEESGGEEDEPAKDVSSAPPSHPPPALPRAPPPPPPGPPPLLDQTFPPRFGLPPGPPPGAPPPPRFPGSGPPHPLMGAQIHSRAVLSAPPTRSRPGAAAGTKSAGPVISAQPQLRNMTAEVTKFMPTSLRVRRDQPKSSKPKVKLGEDLLQQQQEDQVPPAISRGRVKAGTGVHVQGDAYDTFMHEMQGLL